MKTHGGKRKNSGRKKLPKGKKKYPVTVYITKDSIDEYGIDRLKERMLLAAEN